jgi:hypothetical protein
MAGEEISLRTGPPQVGQTVSASSENFWMISKRRPFSASHSYS